MAGQYVSDLTVLPILEEPNKSVSYARKYNSAFMLSFVANSMVQNPS